MQDEQGPEPGQAMVRASPAGGGRGPGPWKLCLT